MKKIFTLGFVCFLLMMGKMDAQSKFYFGIDGGYGFGFASSSYAPVFGSSVTYQNFVYSDSIAESKSIGAGFNFGGYIGYSASKHISFEIDASYLLGKNVEYDYPVHHYTIEDSYGYTDSWKATTFRLIPTIKIKGDSARIVPYLKLGFSIGISPVINNDVTETHYFTSPNYPYSTSFDYTSDVSVKYSGGVALGFMASLGADYKLSKCFDVFCECRIMSQSFCPLKSEITNYIVNGVSYPYPISYQYGANTRYYYPLNSIGINIGITYHFGKKADTLNAPNQ